MSAPVAVTGRGAGPAATGPRLRFGGLLAAEWTKIRSVRSTFWTLILFVLITIGLSALLTFLTELNWTNGPGHAARDAGVIANPIGLILGIPIGLGQLTICVLGVMVISAEYSTGVIRSSLLATPNRLAMLAAKATIFAALILVLAEIVVFASFFLGQALLNGKAPVSLSDPGISRAVIGSGLYLTVLGLLALAVGALIRHTAGAISAIIGVVLVVPIIAGFLPGSWGAHINAYLPEQAGTLLTQAHLSQPVLLTPWQGFGILCAWTALTLAVASWLLLRRDA